MPQPLLLFRGLCLTTELLLLLLELTKPCSLSGCVRGRMKHDISARGRMEMHSSTWGGTKIFSILVMMGQLYRKIVHASDNIVVGFIGKICVRILR